MSETPTFRDEAGGFLEPVHNNCNVESSLPNIVTRTVSWVKCVGWDGMVALTNSRNKCITNFGYSCSLGMKQRVTYRDVIRGPEAQFFCLNFLQSLYRQTIFLFIRFEYDGNVDDSLSHVALPTACCNFFSQSWSA